MTKKRVFEHLNRKLETKKMTKKQQKNDEKTGF